MCRSRSCVKPKLACRKISNFFLTSASGCCMKPATQEGVSATSTGELPGSPASRSAVLPRTHPIHEKPTIIVAPPPPITPQTAGFSQGACSCMRALLILGAGIFCPGLYEAGGLPASSACGSAEAPRVPPSTATGTAGRGLLHAELAAVEVLAVELRNRLIGLFRRGHLHETEAA